MKKLLPLILSIITSQLIFAQSRENGDGKHVLFSLGPELGIPNNSPFTISYGATAKAEVKVMEQLGITLTSGYNIYRYRNSLLNAYQVSIGGNPAFVPLKAGARYYAGPGFYAEGELGAAVNANSTADNLFVYSIGFGFSPKLNSYSSIDIGFRYEGYSKREYQVTGIRVAYRVGW